MTDIRKFINIVNESDYEYNFDKVCAHAWDIWTHNGFGMDEDEQEQTVKSVADAATNVYRDGISDVEWLDATLARLGHSAGRQDTRSLPKFDDLDGFTKGYFEAMLWTDEENLKNDGADVNYYNIDPEDAAKQIADCERFKIEGAALLQQAWDQHHMSDESAGHNFWLTRNGHGTGFWDEDLDSDAGGKKLGDALTALCKKFGEVWTYVGDDKLIHISD